MIPIVYRVFFLLLISIFCACKKDHQPEPLPTEPVENNLTINLDTSYISGKQVDSVIVTWTTGGQSQILNLEVRGNKLVSSLRNITPGTGEMNIQLYSNRKFMYYNSLWLAKKQLTVKKDENLILKGPTGFNDQDWLPRVLLYNIYMSIDAIVGLRPADPYFFVRNAEKNAQEIWFSREYWKTRGGLQKIGGGVWECKTGCLNTDGHIYNEDFFKFLPAQMGSRQYDHIEIILRYLMDKNGGGYSIDMNYTFPAGT